MQALFWGAWRFLMGGRKCWRADELWVLVGLACEEQEWVWSVGEGVRG